MEDDISLMNDEQAQLILGTLEDIGAEDVATAIRELMTDRDTTIAAADAARIALRACQAALRARDKKGKE